MWLIIILIPLVSALLIHTLRPVRADKYYHRQTAEYISNIALNHDYLITDSKWVLHYSRVNGKTADIVTLVEKKLFLRHLRAVKATLLAVRLHTTAKCPEKLRRLLRGAVFHKINEFPQTDAKGKPDSFTVYRINKDKLTYAATGI